MKKLLITGISGFLGWNIAHFPQEDWQLIGTYHSNKPDDLPSSIATYWLDLTDEAATKNLIASVQADAILHLAAHSNTGFCQKYPEQTYSINVQTPHFLAKICRQQQIPFVFTSSEQVFDGLQKIYTESDVPNPRNEYAKQKAQAEKLVMEAYPAACIVRLSVMLGWHGGSSYCFMTDWLNKWKSGQAVTAFTDEIRSFLDVQLAVEGLLGLLGTQAQGIYHIGGEKALSRYELAVLLKEKHGFPNAKIIPRLQKELDVFKRRPPSLVLSNKKLKNWIKKWEHKQ